MKILLTIISIALLGMLSYLVWGFDQWLGIVAYTLPYLLFCVATGLLFWGAWLPVLQKRAVIVGSLVFAMLAVNFVLPPPSERILRSVLLRVTPGTNVDAVEGIVEDAYDGSSYKLPQITHEPDRIHVSLLSQEAGNCTALIIHTNDGVVVSSSYSAD